MFIWLMCLFLASCSRRVQEEVTSIPVLHIGAIHVKNELKPVNNTEGYGTEIWIRKVQNGFIRSNTGDILTLEVLKSTIIPFASHIAFHVKVVYFLNRNPVKTQVEVKGTRDLIQHNGNFSLVLERVSQDISSQILKNLVKDYGDMVVTPKEKLQERSQLSSRRIEENPNLDDLANLLQKANELDRQAGKGLTQALEDPEPRITTSAAVAVQSFKQQRDTKPEPKVIVPVDLLESSKNDNQPKTSSGLATQSSGTESNPGEKKIVTKQNMPTVLNLPMEDVQTSTLQAESTDSSTQTNDVSKQLIDNFKQSTDASASPSNTIDVRNEILNTAKPQTLISEEINNNQAQDLLMEKSAKAERTVNTSTDSSLPVAADSNNSKKEEIPLNQEEPAESQSADSPKSTNLDLPSDETKNTRYEKLVN